MSRSLLIALLILIALLGMADSWYLAQHAATDTALVCDIGAGLDGCNTVAQSPYSKIYGIPLADFGVGFYGVLFLVAALASFVPPRRSVYGTLFGLSIIGSLMSVVFLYIQFVLIQALCIYCIGSAVLSFLSLPLSYVLLTKHSPRPPAVIA